jgi:hypothetical protein
VFSILGSRKRPARYHFLSTTMTKLNARQRAARQKSRNEQGILVASTESLPSRSQVEPDVDDTTEDFELLDLSAEMVAAAQRKQDSLIWKDRADSHFRGRYNSDSTVTLWRKRKAMEHALQPTRGMKSRTLESMGYFIPQHSSSSISSFSEAVVDESTPYYALQHIQAAYSKLSDLLKPRVCSNGPCSPMESFERCKHQAIRLYFGYLLDGRRKLKASEQAARDIFVSPSTSRMSAIRAWAKEYLQRGELSKHRQGKHAKSVSLLSDESIQHAACKWIRAQKHERRDLPTLANVLNNEIIPEKLGVKGSISLTTLWRYMRAWGYVFRNNGKDIFVDGHERADVVEYRQRWARRMMSYRSSMDEFAGDEEELVIEPHLSAGDRKLVLVSHDESTFFAHDGKQDMWLAEGETVLRKKGPGMSIMVSEFQCPCHGTMRSGVWTSRKLFCAGANREGYWKSEDMLEQLVKDAIPLFELLHPDCQAVFIFDQSSNHNAYAADALRAEKMTLKEKEVGSNEVGFRHTKFELNGATYPQSLYRFEVKTIVKKGQEVRREIKLFKGIQRILEERDLWMDEDPYNPKKKWKLDCHGNEADDHCCCARHLLASQPDFVQQKTAICEAIEKAGHIFELYPKFHCECNWIERYWGAAKRVARLECDYSFKSLQQQLPRFLDTISPTQGTPTMIRRFYKRAWRFVEAYSQDLSVQEAAAQVHKFSARQYKSHRRIGQHD